MPAMGPAELPEQEQHLVMLAEVPIVSGHLLVATDMLWSMGQDTRSHANP